jgi:hypothetical protein
LLTAAGTAMAGDRDQDAGGAPEAQLRATRVRKRAALAKRRELAAHQRAINGTRKRPSCRSGSAIRAPPPHTRT